MSLKETSKSLTLLTIVLGFVIVQLDVTVVNVAIKVIGTSMKGDISKLQWIVNAYTLTFASVILTAGTLSDRIGAKRLFVAGFAIFTIASLICGIAGTLVLLIIARAVQGIGASILVPCSLTLLNHSYTHDAERAKAVGIWAAGASAALAAGPILGGALISILSWRSIFYINIPIGLTGIWLTIRYVSETSRVTNKGIDVWGQIAAMGGLALLAASMIQGGKVGWTNTFVLFGFAGFIIFFTLFFLVERKVHNPMVPLSLFSIRIFSATTAIGFLINVSFYGLIFIISLYFQQTRNYSPLKTGLAFLPMMIAILIANLSVSRLTKLIGSKRLILCGEIIFLGGCILLLSISETTNYYKAALLFTATGFGPGLVIPPITSLMLGSVDKSRSGVASGVLNSMRQAGSVVGVALFGSLISGNNQFLKGMHISLIISSGLLLIGILFSLRITEKKMTL